MKSLMIQGTASHVGKTLIVLGICRSLYKKNIKVCPFKAQNITSNIVKTDNNEVIGYAQYLQAKSCNVIPDSRMNPVIIDIGEKTNFIINGKLIHRGDFSSYDTLLPTMKDAIITSYLSLAKEYDVIVIEGAGSPAEINRNNDDISNMWIADNLQIPVILVGNMEYGGCFASIVGTFELLEQRYLSLVKGFILNKYNGDNACLTKGIKYIENQYQKAFLGSIPYMDNLSIPEEDYMHCDRKTPVSISYTDSSFIDSWDILAHSISANIDLNLFL